MHIYRTDSGDYSGLSAVRTIVQWVTGATRKSKILGFGVSFASVTATDAPVLIELGTETSNGTSSDVSSSIVKIDPGDPNPISTARNNFSGAEPTGFTAAGYGPWRVTPIGGTWDYQFPSGLEPIVPVSAWFCIRVTPPAALSTAIRGYLLVQE